MSGAPRHLADDGDFVMVRLSVVDAVGFDAAVLFGWLRFRCQINPDGYRATHGDLMKETRLSEHKVRKASKTLRDKGWITADRADAWDAALVWNIVWDDEAPTRGVESHRIEADVDGTSSDGISTALPSTRRTKNSEEEHSWSSAPVVDAADDRLDAIEAHLGGWDGSEQVAAAAMIHHGFTDNAIVCAVRAERGRRLLWDT